MANVKPNDVSFYVFVYFFLHIGQRSEIRSRRTDVQTRSRDKKGLSDDRRDTNNDTTLCKFLIFFLFCGNMLQLYYRYLNAPRENKNRLETPETNTKKETAT